MTALDTALNTQVLHLLDQEVASGRHLGLQVAAYKDGHCIVDAWAGTLGRDDPRPVRGDSLFYSFSTTKGVAAAALHLLADRGLIAYDAPIARYWPPSPPTARSGSPWRRR